MSNNPPLPPPRTSSFNKNNTTPAPPPRTNLVRSSGSDNSKNNSNGNVTPVTSSSTAKSGGDLYDNYNFNISNYDEDEQDQEQQFIASPPVPPRRDFIENLPLAPPPRMEYSEAEAISVVTSSGSNSNSSNSNNNVTSAAITSTKNPRQKASLETQKDRQAAVILDLVKDEENYTKQIGDCIKKYLTPLRSLTGKHAIVSASEIDAIFGNIESIYILHQDVLARLQKIVANYPKINGSVAKTFLQVGPAFKVYGQYVNSFNFAISSFHRMLEENKKFSDFVSQKEEEDLNSSPLTVCLSLPLNRMTSYERYLESILNAVEWRYSGIGQGNDLRELMEITSVMKETSNYVRISLEQSTDKSAVQDINRRMKNAPFSLVAPNRVWVKESPVLIAGIRNKAKPRYIFIFNDIFVIAKPLSKGMFEFKGLNKVTDVVSHVIKESGGSNGGGGGGGGIVGSGIIGGGNNKSFVLELLVKNARGGVGTDIDNTHSNNSSSNNNSNNNTNTNNNNNNSNSGGSNNNTDFHDFFNSNSNNNSGSSKSFSNLSITSSGSSSSSNSSNNNSGSIGTNNNHNGEVTTSVLLLSFASEKDRREWNQTFTELIQKKKEENVFGTELSLLCKRGQNELPLILVTCLDFIRKKGGMKQEGIFRLSGDKTIIERMKKRFDELSDSVPQELSNSNVDCNCLSGLLKLWLRELPNPILTFENYPIFIQAFNLPLDKRLIVVPKLLEKLPYHHRLVLKYLIEFLVETANESSSNLMTAANLSIVFGPNLLRPAEDTMETTLKIPYANGIIQLLIENPQLVQFN